MLFNSVEFGLFLPVVFAAYLLLRHRMQNWLLLVASWVFYGWWDWRFLLLLVATSVVDWAIGLRLAATARPQARRGLLVVSLVSNLGVLGFFKYFNFFADSAATALGLLGFRVDGPTLGIVLPIGISFYTFQSLAYTIDVYRGTMPAVRRLADFALYVAFFPQLVAGPIERAQRLVPQVEQPRRVTAWHLRTGAAYILTGLFSKVVIADNIAPYVDRAFSEPTIFPAAGLLIATYLFAIQIYADFAGYSDIARGVARLFGFELMENFRQPYLSANVAEFWRRWHISLSTWLRDYLYISLGGNRSAQWRTYRNLLVTMVLGGLWHGAAWTFLAWGALHGGLLALHRWFRGLRAPAPPVIPRPLAVLATFHLVCLAWIPFRAASLTEAWAFVTGLFRWSQPLVDVANPGKVLVPLAALLAFGGARLGLDLLQRPSSDQFAAVDWPWPAQATVYAAMLIGLFLLGGPSGMPFIYFQF